MAINKYTIYECDDGEKFDTYEEAKHHDDMCHIMDTATRIKEAAQKIADALGIPVETVFATAAKFYEETKNKTEV